MKTYLLLFLLIVSFSSNSQENYGLGLKGGINYAGYHTGSSSFTEYFGLNFGGTIEKDFTDLFGLQAELIFNQKGFDFGITTGQNIIVSNRLGYIDMPILFQLKFLKNVHFQAGPQVGFKVYEESVIEDENVDLDINSIDTALVAGFEIKLSKKIFTQIRYAYGLSEIVADNRYKNSVMSFSLGYFIF